MSALKNPLRRGLVAAVVALAAIVPGASAGIDPAVYEVDVPAGQVEHGVYSFKLTGSPMPEDRRVEYWVTAGRWRDQTTDAKTGELIAGRVHDDDGTTWLQYKPVNADPRVLHFKGNDSVPGPGYPAAYNRKLAAGEITIGTAQFPMHLTLQPLGPRTIAGIAGTAYEQLTNGLPGLARPGYPPLADSHTIVVLQDGTYQPLMHDTSVPNGSYGRIDQRETLISRETTPTAQASVKLTKASFKRIILGWKAKVKAAKAIKKKHKR